MQIKETLKLVQKAQSQGGDKYACTVKGQKKPLALYFPQSWTRKNNEPVAEMKLTLDLDHA